MIDSAIAGSTPRSPHKADAALHPIIFPREAGTVSGGAAIVAILVVAAQTMPRNPTQSVMLSPQRSRAFGRGIPGKTARLAREATSGMISRLRARRLATGGIIAAVLIAGDIWAGAAFAPARVQSATPATLQAIIWVEGNDRIPT
jgi:hypothetical protein